MVYGLRSVRIQTTGYTFPKNECFDILLDAHGNIRRSIYVSLRLFNDTNMGDRKKMKNERITRTDEYVRIIANKEKLKRGSPMGKYHK